MSPIEVGDALSLALSHGATFKELAQFLQFDRTSTLREINRLLKLHPDLKHLVGWGGRDSSAPLSMTAASYIARLPVEDQLQTAEAALTHGLTSTEIRQVVETRLTSTKTIEEAVATVVRLRPVVERKHLLIGAVSEDVQDSLSMMTQRQRDALLQEAMSASFPSLGQWKGSLSPHRFSLLGDASFGDSLRQLSGGFEKAINQGLRTALERR